MKKVLLLPNVNQSIIPSYLFEDKKIKDISNVVEYKKGYNEIKEYLRHITQPSIVVGSDTTPPIFWVVAQSLFLNALLIVQADDTHIDIKTGETISGKLLEDNSYSESSTNEKEILQEKEHKQIVATKSDITPISQLKDSDILFQIFKLASWGIKSSSDKLKIEQYLEEVATRKIRNPTLLERAMRKKRDGLEAFTLFNNEIAPKINRLPKNEFELFYNSFREEHKQQKHILKSINIKVKKDLAFKEKKRVTYQHNNKGQLYSNVIPQKIDKHHPNSLRHLKPQTQWDILIDETGTNFDSSAYDLNMRDISLGKCVALISPKILKKGILPNIGNHHATEAVDSKNDSIINSILKAPVGVLGFTVKDEINSNETSWFNSIYLLIKWILKLIPIAPEKGTKLTFLIEQRSAYDESINLMPIIEVLLAELSELNPNRYAKVKIDAKFIGKENEHPLNGYIDTIAHMWGSPTRIGKDRLKKSKMLGHCLIRPSDNVMERLYQSLEGAEDLSAKEWYSLMSAISEESEGSLLYDTLKVLGKIVQSDSQKWKELLEEVHAVLSGYYEPLHVRTALLWLEEWMPANMQLSGITKLHQISVELDSLNHLGIFDENIEERLGEIEKLRNELFDEAAHELCEIDLRIMVSLTNIYEFHKMKDILDFWKKQETATITLESKGKLLSTEGQYYAFIGDPYKAVDSFNKSIEHFNKLSDASISNKNCNWTNSYRITAMMDCGDISSAEIRNELCKVAQSDDLVKRSKKLAKDTGEERFVVYLFLRAFVYYPIEFKEEIEAYVSLSKEWYVGNVAPWEVINIYRAWMLFNAGDEDQAKEFAKRAFFICNDENQGVTTKWIGYVLQLLATNIGLVTRNRANIAKKAEKLVSQFTAFPIDSFKRWAEIERELSQRELIKMLTELTPFNFH